MCEGVACGVNVQGVRWGRSEWDWERGRVAAGNCGGREGYILMGEILRKGEEMEGPGWESIGGCYGVLLSTFLIEEE